MIDFKISNSSKISQCCKHKRNKAYNFLWKYKNDKLDVIVNFKREGKRIGLLNNDGIIIKKWDRILDCAKELNITSSAIVNSLSEKDRRKTVFGMKFKYLENEFI